MRVRGINENGVEWNARPLLNLSRCLVEVVSTDRRDVQRYDSDARAVRRTLNNSGDGAEWAILSR